MAPSRRSFLASGLALPAVSSASPSSGSAQSQAKCQPPARSSSGAALQYRTLGKTGQRVTTVGYGTMITSDPTVIARAVDLGINYFDTARNYQNGNNERMVGAALGARRKHILLASKSSDNPTSGPGILAEIDTSLKELNTEYLDVWHLHGMDKPADITDELIDAQRKARQQGKIRFVGVSTHNLPAIVDRAIEAKIEVVQAPYNFASTASYTAAIEKLQMAGVGLIAMKVMAKGARRGGARPPRPDNIASAALKWVIKNPAIATAVPSMTDIGQLEENFRAMSQSFTEADSRILAGHLEEIRPYFCRMCGRCQDQCPKGLPVADIVRFVMYADGYGQFPLGRERFLRMSTEQRNVRCRECSACAVHCPNGVYVASQLSRAQDLFAC